MWKVLAVFYALCSAVIAEDINSCKNVTTSEVQEKLFNTFTNTLFDKVLSSVAKSRAIDRVSLPNIVHNFTSKVIAKISAQVSLYRGILEGLSSLTRTGNCRFEVGECGIDIKADVGRWAPQLQLRGTRPCRGLRPGGHGGRQRPRSSDTPPTCSDSREPVRAHRVQGPATEGSDRCHARLEAPEQNLQQAIGRAHQPVRGADQGRHREEDPRSHGRTDQKTQQHHFLLDRRLSRYPYLEQLKLYKCIKDFILSLVAFQKRCALRII
uniref:Putative secreted protein n=1 Tax=Ixodes ricinus TaxID=34613 RepID=A0A0K8RKV6_IXORI